jgi:hypothetical protein
VKNTKNNFAKKKRMIKTYKNGPLNTDVSASSKSKQGHNRETVNNIIYKIKLDLCIVVKTYLAKFKQLKEAKLQYKIKTFVIFQLIKGHNSRAEFETDQCIVSKKICLLWFLTKKWQR